MNLPQELSSEELSKFGGRHDTIVKGWRAEDGSIHYVQYDGHTGEPLLSGKCTVEE